MLHFQLIVQRRFIYSASRWYSYTLQYGCYDGRLSEQLYCNYTSPHCYSNEVLLDYSRQIEDYSENH